MSSGRKRRANEEEQNEESFSPELEQAFGRAYRNYTIDEGSRMDVDTFFVRIR